MRFIISALLLLLLAFVATAAAPQKAIVVSYEDPNTPQSVIDQAMDTIRAAGGVITHEYSKSKVCKRIPILTYPDLFKGFAAKASEKAIESLQTLGSEYVPIVEQDITYSVQDN